MYYIIVNPKAGHGQSVIQAKSLESRLTANNIKCSTSFTTGINCAYHRAKEICGDARFFASAIIGIGGDGTVQEIAAGMADAFTHSEKIPIPLCICPAGSGNDFVMSVSRKRQKKSDEAFFDSLVSNNSRAVDIITANGRAYLNIGNAGLDAWIVKNAADLKEKYGARAYLAAVFKSINSYKPINLSLELDSKKIFGAFTLVAVCNGQYYGGGLHISPSAKIDDGKITLCAVRSMSKLKTMAIFPSLMIKKHMYLGAVNFYECTGAKITFLDNEATLCLDGNLSPAQGTIEFKIYKQVLDIIV